MPPWFKGLSGRSQYAILITISDWSRELPDCTGFNASFLRRGRIKLEIFTAFSPLSPFHSLSEHVVKI